MVDYDLETGEITNWTFNGDSSVPSVHPGYAGGDILPETRTVFRKESSNYSIVGINCLNLENQNMGRYITEKLYELIISSL